MTAEIKSRGETVRVGSTRGRYKLLARLIGKKEAKAILRGRTENVRKSEERTSDE